KIPLVLVAPGRVPPGVEVGAPARSTDIAPTVLELLGLEPHARTTGASLLGLARGGREPEPRVVVTEGGGSRVLLHDRWQLVVPLESDRAARAPSAALFDLA